MLETRFIFFSGPSFAENVASAELQVRSIVSNILIILQCSNRQDNTCVLCMDSQEAVAYLMKIKACVLNPEQLDVNIRDFINKPGTCFRKINRNINVVADRLDL